MSCGLSIKFNTLGDLIIIRNGVEIFKSLIMYYLLPSL
jgi:hypothetical protein